MIKQAIPGLAVALGSRALSAVKNAGPVGFILVFCFCLTGDSVATTRGTLTIEEATQLLAKMEAEIQGIQSKDRGNSPTETYALVANSDGYYPNVKTGGQVYLQKGNVWKYGQTSDPEHRYTAAYMTDYNLRMQDVFYGTKEECLIVEKIKIYGYYIENGCLPPGNKIFR